MTHEFIVNTERVNEYGYRILTEGIDTEQYMRNPVVLYGHVRGISEPKRVIGRTLKLENKNGELVATVEFDEADDFAKEVAGKVERGYIRMASLYADVKETTTDAEYLLPGQTLETVLACKLVEISITDIGGNDDALKLSKNGQPVQLKKLTNNTKKNDMSLKNIALALGLKEDEREFNILKSVGELKLAKEKAEKKAEALKTELNGIKSTEAGSLIDRAIALNLIPEALKEQQLKAFEADFEGQKTVLSKLLKDAGEENELDHKQNTVKEIVLGNGQSKKKGEIKLTFDYLQKHNVAELRRLKEEEPKEYARLAKEYGEGVRHKED